MSEPELTFQQKAQLERMVVRLDNDGLLEAFRQLCSPENARTAEISWGVSAVNAGVELPPLPAYCDRVVNEIKFRGL